MTQYNLNSIIVIAQNLRYSDNDGIVVTKTYPIEYIIIIGQALSTLLGNFNTLSTTVDQYGTRITALEARTIPNEYTTPEIDGGCIYSGIKAIDLVLGDFITAYCNYIGVAGSQSNLASVVSAFPISGSDAAYAGGTMSGISGWVSSPTKTSEILTNMGLTLADIRTGLTQARTWAKPSCKDFAVNFYGKLSTDGLTLTLYTGGHVSAPTGWVDDGSSVEITDTAGNTLLSSIDVFTTSTDIDLTGSVLLPTSDFTVALTFSAISADTTSSCSKVVIKTIDNLISACPQLNITTIGATSISYNIFPYVTSNVSYAVVLYNDSDVVITTATYTNPTGVKTGTFVSLTPSTTYKIGVTATISGEGTTVCSKTEVVTTTA